MNLALIFDFDGTVANSIEAIFQLINKLAPSYGFEPLSQETFNTLRDLSIPKACR
ncbi:MAG: HAD hydrolase-like protein, partial [Candidatus Syntrophosphaera sp.]|nr:HAD hydrolase-like protein [Candidatus Syntrophosphaera sp.]